MVVMMTIPQVPHRTFAVDMISMMLDGDQHMTG